MLHDFLCLNYQNDPAWKEKQGELFCDLEISKDTEFCKRHMGQHPVIFISLKGVEQPSYEGMRAELSHLVRTIFSSFLFLKQKDLDRYYINSFDRYLNTGLVGSEDLTDNLITSSLEFLCAILKKVYGRKIIVLIDEYDVPVNKAHSRGFYEQILPLVRGMLYKIVKDDQALVEKCVITGCNRISRESIFTGMNNALVYSISDRMYSDVFGFTQAEVDALLEYYALTLKKAIVKNWYDGYSFGGTGIYNPWDVTNYCYDLINDPTAKPVNYWANTSSNEIIREFMDHADPNSLEKMQSLLNGESVKIRFDEQLVYPDLEKEHSSVQLFSILYSSGYLTAVYVNNGEYELKIPNLEIMDLFKELVTDFYRSSDTLYHACAAELPKLMAEGFSGPVEDRMNLLLSRFISVRNTGFEIAYHLFFVVVLSQVLGANSKLRSEPEAARV